MSEIFAVMDVIRSVDLKLKHIKGQPEFTLPLDWESGQVGAILLFDTEEAALDFADDPSFVTPLETDEE